MRGPASERTGAAIRKLRLARGWTLAELSAASGLPVSTLSRMELGQNGLSNDKLVRLCRALDVDVTGIVVERADRAPTISGRRAVTRAGEGEAAMLGPLTGLRAAADLLDKAFTPTVVEVTTADLSEHGPMTILAGETYLHVLAGEVVLHSQLYAPLRLRLGDGVYFDGRSPHALLSGGPTPARALLIEAGDLRLRPDAAM